MLKNILFLSDGILTETNSRYSSAPGFVYTGAHDIPIHLPGPLVFARRPRRAGKGASSSERNLHDRKTQ